MGREEKFHFDKIADVFDTRFNVYEKPAGRARVLRRVAMFSEFCRFSHDSIVLEIGCGSGEYSRFLAGSGYKLICTDISLNMLSQTSRKLEVKDNFYRVCASAEEAVFKDNAFDAIIGNSVLHHLDVSAALKQLYRILKTGGYVAFSEPNMLNPYIFCQKNIKFLKKITGDSPAETAFFRTSITNAFLTAGFNTVEIKPFDFLFPFTPELFVNFFSRLGLALEKTFLREIAGSLFITAKK